MQYQSAVVTSFRSRGNLPGSRLRPLRTTLLVGGSVLLLCRWHFMRNEQHWLADRAGVGAAANDASSPRLVQVAGSFERSKRFTAPWMPSLQATLLASAAASASLPASLPTEMSTLGLPVLPHRLHQTWKDFYPPSHLFSPRWRHSLRAANPRWQYRLWSDDENRGLVAARYPWLLATYDGYPTPIQRADVARYLIVHTHGGIYADLDIERVPPFKQ